MMPPPPPPPSALTQSSFKLVNLFNLCEICAVHQRTEFPRACCIAMEWFGGLLWSGLYKRCTSYDGIRFAPWPLCRRSSCLALDGLCINQLDSVELNGAVGATHRIWIALNGLERKHAHKSKIIWICVCKLICSSFICCVYLNTITYLLCHWGT